MLSQLLCTNGFTDSENIQTDYSPFLLMEHYQDYIFLHLNTLKEDCGGNIWRCNE